MEKKEKTGTVKMDINEYDRLMDSERRLKLNISRIEKDNMDLMHSIFCILEASPKSFNDIEMGVTNAGYSFHYESHIGIIKIGKGSQLVNFFEKSNLFKNA